MSFVSEQALQILLVRMSSMGDLVHILPTIQDIHRHFPHAQMDWVAEEAFVPIAQMSPLVRHIFPIALRRWRKSWLARPTRQERQDFRQRLRAQSYDIILDLQGLLKSAVVARSARGRVTGLDWQSAKEPYASWWYHQKVHVPWAIPMVQRYRMIAAAALGYSIADTPIHFGSLQTQDLPPIGLPERFVSIMPSASVDKKLWQPEHWQVVLRWLRDRGQIPIVFSGNAIEQARAQSLIADIPDAVAVAPMPLQQVLSILAHSQAMIGLDSGLTHAAAALGIPTIGLYWPTAPDFAPIYGAAFTASYGGNGRHATVEEVLGGLQQIFVRP